MVLKKNRNIVFQKGGLDRARLEKLADAIGMERGTGREWEEELEALNESLLHRPSKEALRDGIFIEKDYTVIENDGNSWTVRVPFVTEKGRQTLLEMAEREGWGSAKEDEPW